MIGYELKLLWFIKLHLLHVFYKYTTTTCKCMRLLLSSLRDTRVKMMCIFHHFRPKCVPASYQIRRCKLSSPRYFDYLKTYAW